MCLCGMLAGDYDTLPEPMRAAVIRLFENGAWLTDVLGQRTERKSALTRARAGVRFGVVRAA